MNPNTTVTITPVQNGFTLNVARAYPYPQYNELTGDEGLDPFAAQRYQTFVFNTYADMATFLDNLLNNQADIPA